MSRLFQKCWLLPGKTKNESNHCLQEYFVKGLIKSTSNHAGCKRYVSGSSIAFPETFVENPLVIDSFLIDNNQQVVTVIHQ